MQVGHLGLGIESLHEILSFLKTLIHTQVNKSNLLSEEVFGSAKDMMDVLNRWVAPRGPEVDNQDFPRLMLECGIVAGYLINEILYLFKLRADLDWLHINRDQIGVRVHIVKNLFDRIIREPFDCQGLAVRYLARNQQLALLYMISALQHEHLMVSGHRLHSVKSLLFQEFPQSEKFRSFFVGRELPPLFGRLLHFPTRILLYSLSS